MAETITIFEDERVLMALRILQIVKDPPAVGGFFFSFKQHYKTTLFL